jgi:predicted ATPase/DNA-binding SARP family transcriptional activator
MHSVGLDFRVLGPLEVVRDGRPLRVGGPKQRAVLALLVLEAGELVPAERIVEEIWPEARGGGARSLQVYVSDLRKLLDEPDRIRGEAGGYRLEARPEEIDARRFERLLAEGRRLRASGEPAGAAEALRQALGLWRGAPLADLAYESPARVEITRLEGLRVDAYEELIEAELALGHHREVLPEIEALVAAEPLRERPRRQLMLALYRCGRQADALDAYQDARRTLVDELGLEPGQELRELEAAILRQERSLLVEPAELRARRRLPAPPTELVGRRREVAEVVELLQDGSRLVTLTGPGGTGKTRLALQAAHELAERFEDGVVFVGLAALRDPDLVPDQIARALGVEVRERAALGEVARHLHDRKTLLLVDNFEQVDEAAPVLSALLTEAARAKLLVTSRHRLDLYGEHEYPVPPLMLEEEALPLFVARARAAGAEVIPDDSVRELCLALDCLPLAIELAAGRLRDFPLTWLLETLPRRLELAAGGPRDVPERQRTLTATIAWSYELLDEQQRRLFQDLSVFAGGFEAEAAEAVCEHPGELEALVSRSLVASQDGRYTLLETIREFAAARLRETPRADAVADRHGAYYLALAEQADRAFGAGGGTVEWLDRLESEHDNFRAALDRAADGRDGELGLHLAVMLGRFWEWRSHIREGLDRLELALEHAGSASIDPSLRARALMRAGVFAHYRGEFARARERIEDALALARSSGAETVEANALRNLGALAKDAGEHARAQALHEEARTISARAGDRLGLCSSLINLSDVALSQRDYARAETLAEEGALLARELGHEVLEAASLLNFGLASLHRGRAAQARATLGDAVRLSHTIRSAESLVVGLEGLAALDADEGDPVRAAQLMGAADALLETAGYALESGEREVHDRTLSEVRGRLDQEDFAQAWREGRALSLEEAIQLGLDATAGVAQPNARS